MELSLLSSECFKKIRSLEHFFHRTFAAILKNIRGKHYSNLSVGIFWQTFAAVYLSGLYNNGLSVGIWHCC